MYIIGSAVGGRVSFNSNEDHDAMDGELVCRVLQLMQLTDSRLSQGGCDKLELALLSFFEQFRKIYIGDQVTLITLFPVVINSSSSGSEDQQGVQETE